jgi:hypothetical protein
MATSKNDWKEGEGEDAYRHQCLVREVIRMRIEDRNKAWQWLDGWQQKHDWSNLRNDVFDQWKKGNRGEHGDWR